MTNFLEGLSSSLKEQHAAEEEELQSSLRSSEKSQLPKEGGAGSGNSGSSSGHGPSEDGADALGGATTVAINSDLSSHQAGASGVGGTGNVGGAGGISINVNAGVDGDSQKPFVPPKDFQAAPPKIVLPSIKVVNKFESPKASPDEFDKSMFSAMDKKTSSHPVNDSSSLRKVIREELSELKEDAKLFTEKKSSPSQLRQAIKDELQSIIKKGGIAKLAPEKTLRGIIHDELEKAGALDQQKQYHPEKLHIDESLIDPSLLEEDLKVIEIMQKNPDLRTRREELSLLGKLEDMLVDLKISWRSGSRKKATHLYRRLKKEALTLRFYLQEKRFLLDELSFIAKGLFFSTRARQGVKKVILRESTGEIMDPNDFTGANLETNHRPVYHQAVDKKGKVSFVDPHDHSRKIHRDIFGTEWRTEQKPRLPPKEPVSYVTSPKRIPSPLDGKKIFYLLEKQDEHKSRVISHERLNPRHTHHLFKDSLKEKSSEKPLSPWEDKKQQMHDPAHTKEYLKALKALRQKDKSTAVQILSGLHEKYPKNVAIKVRLHDALEL
ncbi:MAG: hypothetical protein KC535_04095 [Nanoarchaeota archaeon]|nr:hypothetical protein [Nanoarchaeota archaeon]